MKARLQLIAISILLHLISVSQNPSVLVQQAILLHEKQIPSSSDTAAHLFKQALSISPGNSDALGNLALVYADKVAWVKENAEVQNLLDSAHYYADKALQKDQTNTSALFAKALAAYRKNKYSESKSFVQQVIALNPKFPRAARYYRATSRFLGDFFDFAIWSKKVWEQEPSEAALWNYALAYAFFEEDAIAEQMWSKVLEINPNYGIAYGEIAYLRLLKGDTKGAVDMMKRAAKVDNREINQLGIAYMLTAHEDYKAALEKVNSVLEKNPFATMYGAGSGQVLKAFLLSKLNQKAAALELTNSLIDELKNKAAQSQEQLVFFRDLAVLYLIKGEKEKALNLLENNVGPGVGNYRYLYTNPYFKSLHGNTTFEKLVAQKKERVLQQKEQWLQQVGNINPEISIVDFPRVWNQKDRSELVHLLKTNRDSIVKFLKSFNASQLQFKEAEIKWSIMQIFEHLERFELSYLREVNTVAGMPLPQQKFLLMTTAEDQFFRDYETDTARAISNALMDPINRFSSIDKAIESFLVSRNAFIKFIETTEVDLRRYFTFRNFKDGRQLSNPTKWNVRDLHQLILTTVSHAYRHMHQMEKVAAHPAFPKL